MVERKYGLIGKRLDYSYSKRIHEFLMQRFGGLRGARYDLIEMDELRIPVGYAGFNITNPYKSEAALLCAEKDGKEAACFGPESPAQMFCGVGDGRSGFDAVTCYREIVSKAVNTLAFESSRITCHNTDVFGFCYAFGEFLRGAEEVVILGKGSTSKMVQILCRHLGLPFAVVGREGLRARRSVDRSALSDEEGSRDGNAYADRYADRDTVSDGDGNASCAGKPGFAAEGRCLLVNCTPIGTRGVTDEPGALGIDRESMRRFAFFADLTYHPEDTELILLARSCGVAARSGLEMLAAQAVMAQRIWNHRTAGETEVESMVNETLLFLRERL